jgi:hypothetical protein
MAHVSSFSFGETGHHGVTKDANNPWTFSASAVCPMCAPANLQESLSLPSLGLSPVARGQVVCCVVVWVLTILDSGPTEDSRFPAIFPRGLE